MCIWRRPEGLAQIHAMYEDILAGILGAKKGGFKTAAVYEERSKEDEKEILKECDYYIDSFINFL